MRTRNAQIIIIIIIITRDNDRIKASMRNMTNSSSQIFPFVQMFGSGTLKIQ